MDLSSKMSLGFFLSHSPVVQLVISNKGGLATLRALDFTLVTSLSLHRRRRRGQRRTCPPQKKNREKNWGGGNFFIEKSGIFGQKSCKIREFC